MTHPRDQVYRFRRLAHWGQGYSKGLVFGAGDDATLSTLTNLEACLWAEPPVGTSVVGFGRDVCDRLIWMTSDGALWTWSDGAVTLLAHMAPHLAEQPIAILWGQNSGWIASDISLHRIDVHTGDRTGNFARQGWRVIGAVPDLCDGVIVLEVHGSGAPYALRQIRADGVQRELKIGTELTKAIAITRLTETSPIQIVDQGDDDWRIIAVTPNTDDPLISTFPGDSRQPGPVLTMDGPHRLVFGTEANTIFSAALGAVEPAQDIACIGPILDLTYWDSTLFVATATGIYQVQADPLVGAEQRGLYMSPVMRSPLGIRAGWQRADLMAQMPKGGQIRIRSRGFDSAREAGKYTDLLKADPNDPDLESGWNDQWISIHNGIGKDETARHYLGEEKREFIAIRIDISVPACVSPVRLTGLDVIYPDRSLIEDLPDIYQTGDRGEDKVRRMLSPFQALADDIDDLIGGTVQRIDPDQADGLWAGFLLSWLGYEAFAGLPEDLRKSLLRALPDILPLRGTMAGLDAALTALAPDGFAIDNPADRPDLWILPKSSDPIGARLGCDTAAAAHHPAALRLDDCGGLPLGEAVLFRACLDAWALALPCSSEITIHLFGTRAESLIGPFADRIARHFLPANTRARFVFGSTPRSRTLGDGPIGDASDPQIILDQGSAQKPGRWALPRVGPGTDRQTETIETAVLDGTLILQ